MPHVACTKAVEHRTSAAATLSRPTSKRSARGELDNRICAQEECDHNLVLWTTRNQNDLDYCVGVRRPMRVILFLTHHFESVSDAAVPRNFLFLNLIT